MLTFHREAAGRRDVIALSPESLVIAGWAGRDEAAIRHHIDELAAIGVPPPSSVPVYYRAAAATLTQSPRLEVLGPDSSGEAEPVIVSLADGSGSGSAPTTPTARPRRSASRSPSSSAASRSAPACGASTRSSRIGTR